MEKIRNYKFDNLKAIMIFFVVFGHCLELIKGNISKNIYVWIYTFHMPIFVYISGYFAKFNFKKILKFTYLYLIWQTIYCLFEKNILNYDTKIQYIRPIWLMWYMMAIISWTILIKLFDTKSKRKSIIFLILAFTISIIIGFIDKIGYWMSLSRIINFFPYFLLGYYSKNIGIDFLKIKDIKNNMIKIVVCIIVLLITAIYFLKINNVIKVNWLYGSYSYNKGGYDFFFKIMWILLSLCELIIFYNIVPNKNINAISKIGSNTLSIYLLHGFIIKIFQNKIFILKYSEITNILISLCISSIMIIVLGIIIPNMINSFRNKYINKFIKNKTS